MTSYALRFIKAVRGADERTKRVIAAAVATYIGRFGQGIAVIITLPIARKNLQPELFGVWMMLSALLSFMVFADLGIGNGILNSATKAKAAGDQKLLRQILAAGYAITGLVSCLLLLVWNTWVQLSTEPTALAGSISVENQPQVLSALSIFFVVFAINIPASLILRVQLGLQQGYLNGLNQLACAVLTIVLVPLTLQWGGSVPELVIVTFGVQALVNIINSLAWLHHQRMFSKHNWLLSLDAQTISFLLRTGSLFFLLQLSAAFAFQSDAIVITQTLGQNVYGDFAVIQKLFLFVSMILSAATLGLWPAFGDAIATKNMDWARTALLRSAVTVAVIATMAGGMLSVAIPWILAKWMHAGTNPAWGLIAVLALWTVIDATSGVFAAFMNGANILRAQLLFAIGMSLSAFGAKWALTPILGPAGAVLSTILAYCLISVPGQIYIFKQAFKAKD